MKRSSFITVAAAFFGMLVLILDGQTAIEGVRSGIDICLRTLIPSLFPFFVLSGIATASLVGQPIPWLNWAGKLCHMPRGSESYLAVGLLAGYPAGAGNLWSARQQGYLSEEEASRLAVFCNNAGPAFLFGVLGSMFPDRRWSVALWIIQILSALMTGFLLPGNRRSIRISETRQADISDCVGRSIRNMAAVCGWVILFRMIIAFLDRWILWLLPASVRVLLVGILELSNGCLELRSIASPQLRFLLASAMLSFGGLCILMQTQAVHPGLRWKQYIPGKLIHFLISTFLSIAALPIIDGSKTGFTALMSVVLSGACVFCFYHRKIKKEVAIP